MVTYCSICGIEPTRNTESTEALVHVFVDDTCNKRGRPKPTIRLSQTSTSSTATYNIITQNAEDGQISINCTGTTTALLSENNKIFSITASANDGATGTVEVTLSAPYCQSTKTIVITKTTIQKCS